MKIALVHDHLNQWGGAENVFLAMLELFPEADIHSLIFDSAKVHPGLRNKSVTTSFIAQLPFSQRFFEWYLPLLPHAIEHIDLSKYDVVISSDSSFAKGVITAPHAIHICYCHTPPRFLWNYSQGYTDELRQPTIVKKLLPLFLTRLRMWDYQAAQRVDYFIANSVVVSQRIKKYYGKDSIVLYPFVEFDQFYLSNTTDDYFLAMGRLRPYKRFDLAIQAFNKIGMKLKIIGTGSDEKRLRSLAGPTIEFLGSVSNQERAKYLAHCKAFINPQEEDFGITVLEAMASGRPVIAFGRGGANETVTADTGVLFDQQDWETLATTVITFDETKYTPSLIRTHALSYTKEQFKKELLMIVKSIQSKEQHHE